MEGRGGCCIARYGGAGADAASKVGRIMLKFRPIAPKPVAVLPGSASKPESNDASGSTATTGRGRKRRSSSGSSGSGSGKESRRGRRKKAAVMAVTAVEEEEAPSKKWERDPPDPITLPLMPETPERKEEVPSMETLSPPSDLVIPYVPPPWYGLKQQQQQQQVLAPTPLRPAGSLVTVECVTDTCGDEVGDVGRWLCSCKEEVARVRLEGDAWPAFISDASERVTWTNEAYRKMVGREEEGGGVRVALATRGKVAASGEALFTCRVRVKYACSREKGSLTAPCDVCRLEDGGLAWRLDIDAALSLKR